MNATKTSQKPIKLGNLEFSLAMKGKSGNLTHGDRRTKRNRDRSAQRRNAIRDAS